MKSLLEAVRTLHNDESGAAFIEYTALLGVILAVGLAVLAAVGGWTEGIWSSLCSNLNGKGGVGCKP